MTNTNKLNHQQKDELLTLLETRFNTHPDLHPSLDWNKIKERLVISEDKLWSLYQMETTGGEPDVLIYDQAKDAYLFVDTSAESPSGRRSLCYDRQALDQRKANKPENSALDLANSMGVTLLDETEYRLLQQHGQYDLKTSSWILTTPEVRHLGGALFCDRRYDQVFLYHNGADSYYGARGFRTKLWI